MSTLFNRLGSFFSKKPVLTDLSAVRRPVKEEPAKNPIEAFDRLVEIVAEYERVNGVLLTQLERTSQLHKKHVECSNVLVSANFSLREDLFKSQMHCKILEGDLRLVNPGARSLDMSELAPILDRAAKESLAAIDREVADSGREALDLLDRVAKKT